MGGLVEDYAVLLRPAILGGWRRLREAGWAVMTLLSTIVGLYGWYHALRHIVRMQAVAVTEADGALLLAGHLMAVASALMIGPWQFRSAIRRARPRLHRWTGRTYVLLAVTGGVSGLILSVRAVEAPVATTGFALLALGWTLATLLGYLYARRRAFTIHRRWMVRSFALAFSAVTLRIYLPPLIALTGDFDTAQQWGVWLCWVPNLLVAEWILSRGRAYAGSAPI